VPWVVPQELRVPSEPKTDVASDNAMMMALRDVELDWYKVLGYRAVIYGNASWNPATSRATATTPAVFFGDVTTQPWLESTFGLTSKLGCALDKGVEAHCVVTVESYTWNGVVINAPAVIAAGNGTRGAIYAAYAFSEHVLGVAPFYLFTFDQPKWTGSTLPLTVPSVQKWSPPQFKHRAIFLNDEELLGFFRRDPLGEQIFDLVTIDNILQTLLRAKGNTIIMGTTPYPDERSLKLAARRGVVLTASHFEIVGFNAFAWSQAFGHESSNYWDWGKHPDLMSQVWKATIAAQKDYEMIWSVGLRGLNDYAYPNCKAEDPGPAGCGAVISEAVANQTKLLSEVTGTPIEELDFKFNLWVEALGMYQKGLLKLPPQTSLVMSDEGAGFIRGDPETFANADGVYYHVQMLNGDGGQITEFVPPSRIFEQLSSFMHQARSTKIFVLNLSDLKPAVLSAAAALSFVWDPTPYVVNASGPGQVNRTGDEAEALFMKDWTAQQFTGADAATQAAISSAWTSYFELPWIARGSSDEMLGGQIGGLAGSLMQDLAKKPRNITAATVAAAQRAMTMVASGLANATKIHSAAVQLLSSAGLPPSRVQFLKSHLFVQSGMQQHSVEAIAALANATLSLVSSNGVDPTEIAAAVKQVQAALVAMNLLFAKQRAGEGDGEWRGMYWADRHRFTNFQARRREIVSLLAVLQTVPYNPATQIDCCQMEYSYQWTPSHLASYPLFYDNEEFRARDFVMVSCANVTADGGLCSNLPEGGVFSESATVTLTLPLVTGDPDVPAAAGGGAGAGSGVVRGGTAPTIKYTLDGSDPATSKSSVVYTKPLELKDKTTLRAVKIGVDGAAVVQQRNVTFTKH